MPEDKPQSIGRLEVFKVIIGTGLAGVIAWSYMSQGLKQDDANSEAQREFVKDWTETQKTVIKNCTAALTAVEKQGVDIESAMLKSAESNDKNTRALNKVYSALKEDPESQ